VKSEYYVHHIKTVACDVTAAVPVSVQHSWWRRLWKQASTKEVTRSSAVYADKPARRV